MHPNIFLSKLVEQGWMIDLTPVDRLTMELPPLAAKRLSQAPQEFIDFVCSFSETLSPNETEWFLSYKDYLPEYGNTDDAFVWNSFEMDSIEYADNDMISEIEKFWDHHIPFYMSVNGNYEYIAICVDGDNYGKIYQGSEPEYESPTLIANNLPSFLNNFLKS